LGYLDTLKPESMLVLHQQKWGGRNWLIGRGVIPAKEIKGTKKFKGFPIRGSDQAMKGSVKLVISHSGILPALGCSL
jgi:hypothetical protein